MIATIDDLQKRALFYAVILLWAHVPLVGALGVVLGKGGLIEAAMLALVAGLVTFEKWRLGPALAVQMAASAGLAVAVSTIVYMLRGHPWQADSHMIFFAAFALTAVFCDWRPIVTYASVIAVHHLVLNFTFTEAVFPGEASLGRVTLHAVVLVVQTVPLIWLSMVLARMFQTSDALLCQANESQQEAMNSAESLTKEREALQNVVQSLSCGLRDLSVGNLTRPISDAFAAGYDALRTDFNTTLEKLSDTIAQVVDASQSIRARSNEISTASEDLSRRTENQAAALEETAAALDELTASVKSAADGAREVEGIVHQARKEAEASSAVVEGAVAAMSEIERSSQQISQIIGSIDDIAFQTNLLALNAGVEAARAGDAGKGFAVVASEVRALAQRSSAAAKEIKTLIGTSAQHVGRGVEQVGKAGEALHNIVGSVASISTLVSNIAVGATEQSTGLAEINIGVTQLDQVTQQNAAMVEETTAASHALSQDATGLATIVSKFKVGQGTENQGRIVALSAFKRHTRSDVDITEIATAEDQAAQAQKVTGTNGNALWKDF
ncbi:methyl-accepting chemotaxis protein [Rhodobacter ferrooxidans]|uniref:Methyl-accepting chemotaxis sensory transducer n=1 Tax=Rhodobacter ferrooxidans TaxID=371731 RepID=C8RW43_9RHOB|nr:methyl-accepting chemotaxis protein [Rhodobacter sp. SW2]EEW26786.1 methyl-accepting chemotaxis sensory transducer [Rhodobacter sp. SW2]